MKRLAAPALALLILSCSGSKPMHTWGMNHVYVHVALKPPNDLAFSSDTIVVYSGKDVAHWDSADGPIELDFEANSGIQKPKCPKKPSGGLWFCAVSLFPHESKPDPSGTPVAFKYKVTVTDVNSGVVLGSQDPYIIVER